jgi:predicted heme/steroid binding protein
MKKASVGAILAVLIVALLWLAACGQTGTDAVGSGSTTSSTITQDTGSTTMSTEPSSGGKVFTLDELAQFNGKNGAPAYVAVDGVVYDVSNARMWGDGKHDPCDLGAVAGADMSDVIAQAPGRMRALLGNMPVVGTLAQ